MNKLEIESKIKEIIALQFDVRLDDIKVSTDFIRDLSADSLDSVEIIMAVEDRFDIIIPDEEAENLLTVQAVMNYMEKTLADESSK